MDIKIGNGYPAGSLSNLSRHPFIFRGVECGSMEGLLQSLKFTSEEMQIEVCKLHGKKAKRRGLSKKWFKTQTLYWQGKAIKRDSQEYQDLLDEAYDALSQNESFKKALLATNNAVLTHSIGKKKITDTVLTSSEFCRRLTKIREKLKNSNN